MSGTELTPYLFEGRNVRLVSISGENWFAATDVARELGYAEAKDLTRSLDDDEKGRHSVPTPGGVQEIHIISEAGVYRAILQRRLNKHHDASLVAKIARFQRFVFHDVLPTIYRTGRFGAAPDPADLRALVNEMIEARLVADPRVAVVEYVAPSEIVAKHQIPKDRRNQNFCKTVGDRLAAVAAEMEIPVKLCRVTRRRLFSVHVVDRWLSNGGLTFIKLHKASLVSGQKVLPFPKQRKPAPEAPGGGEAA